MKIVIDSREKYPFTFRKGGLIEGSIVKKLNVGDYSIEGYEKNVAIERKSPQDLFQTLGKGHKRFKREIQRAINYDYFVIVVETPFHTIINKEFEGAHYCNMRGDVIIQILFTLKVKYGVDVIFCNNRSEATSIVRNLFKSYIKMKDNSSTGLINIEDMNLLSSIRKMKRKLRCDR